jgi:hypothetical protein
MENETRREWRQWPVGNSKLESLGRRLVKKGRATSTMFGLVKGSTAGSRPKKEQTVLVQLVGGLPKAHGSTSVLLQA